MTHSLPPPPPPLRTFLKAFAAVLLTALSLPVSAQVPESAVRFSRVLGDAPSRVSSLTTPLVAAPPARLGGLTQNLTIEAVPTLSSTTAFGVGSDSRCAYGAGAATRLVEFHNATGTYSRGQPIARACPSWGPAKCSRTVTVRGISYTANRGYPPCPNAWVENGVHVGAPAIAEGAERSERTHNGLFTVRIWGNICYPGGQPCRSLQDVNSPFLGAVNQFGYVATFRPGSNCGPATWPTPEMQAAGGPAYAEWCDVVVDVRR